ncbi:MAG: type 4a pilus biogenesis protein PilO [Oceanobacter sp.]
MAIELQKVDLKAWIAKVNEFEVDDINNIDWENMGYWPLPGKIFFGVLVFIAVLAGGYFLMIDSVSSGLDVAKAKEVKLKADFEKKAFQAANLDKYKAQLAEMEENFGSLLKQLPKDTEVPGLVDDISAAALGAGLKLVSITPEQMVETEFYNELPISITVQGGYHEMGAFVSGVAALPRIVTLHDYNITTLDNGILNMEILAKTYQYEGG